MLCPVRVESVLRRWIEKAQAGPAVASRGVLAVALTSERAEIQQFRRENEILRMERDILKNATVFLAKESS